MQVDELIRSYLTNIPELPGVYRFLDSEKSIIYIGKAKNLKNRISQYTIELTPKNKTMLELAASIEYSVSESESLALLLEAQLIKKFKPRFNILLKDDKSFPYIKLRLDHKYPQLLKFRGKNLTSGKFFGPFASASHVNLTLSEMQKIFRLRSCTDTYFSTRTRPCLQYQIKRCYAPCVNKISKSDYDALVEEVKAFLSGKNQLLQTMLSAKMEEFSNNMEYEKAADIRDRIKAISYIQLKSQNDPNLKDADIIAISTRNNEFCVQVFLYRCYQPCGNQAYFPVTNDESTIEEVLSSFIIQLYQTKVPPHEILLSHEIENKDLYVEALRNLHNIKVNVSIPKLGTKRRLIENALYNAELELEKHLKISAKNNLALKELQELFSLPKLPNRIEVYDNSHIQGAFPIGGMVVAGSNGFEKKEYRLFNIKDSASLASFGGDDYAMLKEVLKRRLKKLKTEPYNTPDLLIIDGGKGHMKIVQQVLNELDIHLPFVCMSKGVDRNAGKEQFHRPGKESFTLDKNLTVMKYLQILRDEAHNFVIKNHRKKRSSAIRISSLDQIEGIGNSRKKALLNYFGSFAATADATEEELKKVNGISEQLAKTIYNSFRK